MWLQITKSEPLGWYAGAGLLHDCGAVAAGAQGPLGVGAECRNEDELRLPPDPMWNNRYSPVEGCRMAVGLWLPPEPMWNNRYSPVEGC